MRTRLSRLLLPMLPWIIPEPMLKAQAESMIQENARRMQSQGISLDQYMQYTGAGMEAMIERMKPQAVKRIQSRLVLEAVAAAEQIEIGEDEIEEEIGRMAEAYKMEVEKVKEILGESEKENMKDDLAIRKAIDLVTEAAVEK